MPEDNTNIAPEAKTSFPSAEKLLAEATKRYDIGLEGWSEIMEAFEEDIRFVNGDQWPDKIRRDREEDDRPCLSDNRLPVFVRQVVGDIRQNKPRIKISPVDNYADVDTAETIEGLVRNIEHMSRADIAYHTAGYNAAGGGIGFIHVTREYASNDVFEQDIKIKRVFNSHSVVLDPSIQEPDGSDADWGFVTEWLNRDDFKERFPGKEPLDFQHAETRASLGNWVREHDVLIANYYRRKFVKQTLVQLANGHTMYQDEHSKLIAGLPKDLTPEELAALAIVKTRETDVSYIQHYLISGRDVLEEPTEWTGQYIPVVPVFGEEVCIDGKRVLHSVIHFAKDNQRMLNYWRSAGTEAVALAPKVPWIGTENQFAGYETEWSNSNKKNVPYLLYNVDPDAPGPPQRQALPMTSTGILTEGEVCVDGIKATIGIFDAGLGRQGNETSGKAILARQREGDNATFTWIDNLALSIAQVGRVVVEQVPVAYDTQRVIRVKGLDGKTAEAAINAVQENGDVLNNLTVGKYDVAIETGPSFTTQRQEAREALIAMGQGNPQMFNLYFDHIARNMDFPGADEMATRARKTIPPHLLTKEERQELTEDDIPQEEQEPSPEMMLEMEKLKVEMAKVEVDQEKVKVDKMKVLAEAGEMEGIREIVAEIAREVAIDTMEEAHGE